MMAMSACTATGSCKTTTFLRLSVPTPQFPQKLSFCSNPYFLNGRLSSPLVRNLIRRSVSSPETPVVEDEQENQTLPSDDDLSLDSGILPQLTGCKSCGREEIENGCNGEGRIQGGIATVPGFGWWPIKAYRPCPAFVASGGRYRRTGQSMDEVVSGNSGRAMSDRTNNEARTSKKIKGPKKSKK